ncbi:HD-GYP domain-containing protein [Novispirillum sp. DQ9]|uniref:HD-GYP domain-containing protein n=1 Tax=Novispirillum sp. DQ9 TaxID=3398612 RepID=UPI003C7A4C44
MHDDGLLFLRQDGPAVSRPDDVQGDPWLLLVVDDEEQVHAVTQLALDGVSFLGRPVHLLSAYSAAEASAILQTEAEVALVLLDVVMETETAGLSLVRWIRRELGNTDIRIILRTAHPGHAPERRVILDYDINDYKTKTELTSERLFSTVVAGLRSYQQVRTVNRLLGDVKVAQRATVFALADLAEHRDTDTGAHIRRVHDLSFAVAEALRTRGHYTDILDDAFLEAIGLASTLHDVGKVSVPDHILRKPGRLDDHEWAVMKTHTVAGGNILARSAALLGGQGYLAMGADIARHHHERFDGGGYPDGLSGQEIPLAARITAVADVYDALISARPYKEAWTAERALAVMREEAGRHFDPLVLNAFLDIMANRL